MCAASSSSIPPFQGVADYFDQQAIVSFLHCNESLEEFAMDRSSSASSLSCEESLGAIEPAPNNFGTSSNWHLNCPEYPSRIRKRNRHSDENEQPEAKEHCTTAAKEVPQLVENVSTNTPQQLRLRVFCNLYDRKVENYTKAGEHILKSIDLLEENCLNISGATDLLNQAKKLCIDFPKADEMLDTSIELLQQAESEQNILTVFELAGKVCTLAQSLVPNLTHIAFLSESVVKDLFEPINFN